VQPFTVMVLAELPEDLPALVDPVVLPLDTLPPPACTWTDVPPADELLEIVPPPPPPLLLAPAVEMLPSAFLLTVTSQVSPAALVPRFVIVSACNCMVPAPRTTRHKSHRLVGSAMADPP